MSIKKKPAATLTASDRKKIVKRLMGIAAGNDDRLALRAILKLIYLEGKNQRAELLSSQQSQRTEP